MKDKLRKCCDPMTILRALSVAVVVGTVLNLINHYELLMNAPLSSKALIQIGLTYLVPYVVSTHGQVWWCEKIWEDPQLVSEYDVDGNTLRGWDCDRYPDAAKRWIP